MSEILSIKALLADPLQVYAGLRRDRLVASTFLLLIAGHETMVGLLSAGTVALLEHPEQRERLRRDPALIGSANRDEQRFPDPEALDLGRSPNKHVAFGFGTHYCLGAPLARLEARAAFLAFLERFPDARLAVPRDQLRWRESMSFAGLKSLPLVLP